MTGDPPKTFALITESGRTPFNVDITVSGHKLIGDEPHPLGGGNLGPAPYDYLTASLGACTAMTVRWYAKRQGWPLDKVEVSVAHHKDGRQDHFTKTITLYGDALSPEQRQALLDIAAKCPVQRTLEGTPLITTLPFTQ